MIGKAELAHAFEAGSHGSTFGGNPLAMAAAKAVLDEVFHEPFLEQVRLKGAWLVEQLQKRLTYSSEVARYGDLASWLVLSASIR